MSVISLSPVDLAIAELWANGTMDEINAFYFSPDFEVKPAE